MNFFEEMLRECFRNNWREFQKKTGGTSKLNPEENIDPDEIHHKFLQERNILKISGFIIDS